MRKYFYYATGVVIILAISLVVYKSLNKPAAPTETDTSAVQSYPEKLPIKTNEGDVEIENIKRLPTATQLSPTDTLVKSTPDYDIIFFDLEENDKSFLISIQSSDPESARTEAESDFLDNLGVTQEESCKLNVSLRASHPDLAGEEFGLSFCPNGKPFKLN